MNEMREMTDGKKGVGGRAERAVRVLVVEDDGPSRGAMVRVLKARGHEVGAAETMSEALRRLEGARPEVMLLDLRLPDGDGEDVLAYVRMRGMGVRVAVITGVVEDERLRAVREMGAEVVMGKPVEMGRVVRWLEGGE